MTDKIDEGGFVYPQYRKQIGGNVYEMGPEGGMTLRQHYAGLAMQAILSNPFSMKAISEGIQGSESAPTALQISEAVYLAAYHHSDGMIAEGNK